MDIDGNQPFRRFQSSKPFNVVTPFQQLESERAKKSSRQEADFHVSGILQR